jgi:glyoxylase-like metal-dependent hydrolase (beta-lactamase superfamily II)
VSGAGSVDGGGPSPLVRLTEHLWWFRDTCNVYVLRSGDAALLIDAGSGAVLDHLAAIGVRQVEWVLHTHHHRDQCQGDARLVAHGARLAVPAREAAHFESVDAFWHLRRQFDDYDVSSAWNTLARPVQVAHRLADHETFRWRDLDIAVLPTPGHTKGSVTFLAELDGAACAFAGDLVAAPGRVDTIHDLQWQYGAPDALGAALHSATLLAGMRIDRLLPSHGSPMDDARGALRALAANLRGLYGLLSEMRRNRVWLHWPHSVDQPKTRVLPHLWANTHALANTYALVADDGRALLLDYGYPSWDHFYADQRFVAHSLDELRALAGIGRVEAVIPSHYHDDHLAGVPFLQRTEGTQAWIHASFAGMVERPSDWKLPCLLGEPIRVDRVLADDEEVRWADWSFEVFHMPGHTWWALGLVGEVDGTRVAFTGDNLLAGAISPLRAAAPIYRNRMRLDSIATGVRRLIDREPELLLTGHTGAIEVTRAMLDDFLAWARQLEGVFVRLCAVPERVNEALDPDFVHCFPYRSTVAPGGRVRLEVRVTNHGPGPRAARVWLEGPDGWAVTPAERRADLGPDGESTLAFEVAVPPGAPPGRHVLVADVTLGERHYGQRAEALVDVAEASEEGSAA